MRNLRQSWLVRLVARWRAPRIAAQEPDSIDMAW